MMQDEKGHSTSSLETSWLSRDRYLGGHVGKRDDQRIYMPTQIFVNVFWRGATQGNLWCYKQRCIY